VLLFSPETLAIIGADAMQERLAPSSQQRRPVITPGKYSVWFKTLVGEGAGTADFFADGTFRGIDSSFAYTGTWNLNAGGLHAKLSAWRTSPGPPSVLGVDDVDLTVTEYASDGDSVMCTGFAKQSPGLRMDITLMRVPDEAPGRAGNVGS
jgi:hypothetical protein